MKSRSKSTGEAMVSAGVRITKSRRASVGGKVLKKQAELHEKAEEGANADRLDLNRNPDYIALSSALSLLNAQKKTAEQDVVALHNLKNEAVANPEETLAVLQTKGTIQGLPKPQNVVKVPIIPWSKYGIKNSALEKRLNQGTVDNVAGFGAVRLFEDSYGERERRRLAM